MIDEKPFTKYKDLYRDIIFGYTTDRFKSGGERVYIKHLTDLEVGHSERAYAEHLRLGVCVLRVDWENLIGLPICFSFSPSKAGTSTTIFLA